MIDGLIIMKRQLLQLIRLPEVLIFSTIQPVMFVLLFRYFVMYLVEQSTLLEQIMFNY